MLSNLELELQAASAFHPKRKAARLPRGARTRAGHPSLLAAHKGGSYGRSAPAPMTATGRERLAEVSHKICDLVEFCTTKHVTWKC